MYTSHWFCIAHWLIIQCSSKLVLTLMCVHTGPQFSGDQRGEICTMCHQGSVTTCLVDCVLFYFGWCFKVSIKLIRYVECAILSLTLYIIYITGLRPNPTNSPKHAPWENHPHTRLCCYTIWTNKHSNFSYMIIPMHQELSFSLACKKVTIQNK